MAGVIGGGGLGGGGGGAAGSTGGGLCVFTCAAVLSSAGAILALYDFDLGAESAFFATSGLGALCFAKCQYLRLAEQKSRMNRKQYQIHRADWSPDGHELGALGDGPPPGGDYETIRHRRDDQTQTHSWEEYVNPPPKASKSKNKHNRSSSKGQHQHQPKSLSDGGGLGLGSISLMGA